MHVELWISWSQPRNIEVERPSFITRTANDSLSLEVKLNLSSCLQSFLQVFEPARLIPKGLSSVRSCLATIEFRSLLH